MLNTMDSKTSKYIGMRIYVYRIDIYVIGFREYR